MLQKIFDSGYFASSHYAPLSEVFDKSTSPIPSKIHDQLINLFNDFKIKENDAMQISKEILDVAK